MRALILTGLIAVALSAGFAGSADAHARSAGCKPPNTYHGKLTTSGVSCAKGRKVMARYLKLSSRGPDSQQVGSYSCSGSYNRRGVFAVCRSGGRRVSYRSPRR